MSVNLQEFFKSVVDDPDYRDNFMARARAGTLDPELELLAISMSEGRVPLALSCTELTSPSQSQGQSLRPSGIPAHQGPALAFIRKVEP